MKKLAKLPAAGGARTVQIALLRGINVGGHKRVPMAELRDVNVPARELLGPGADELAERIAGTRPFAERTLLVEAALEPGELVVTEGVQSLRPGAEVAVVVPGQEAEARAPAARPGKG